MAYLARNEGKVRRQMTRAQLEHLIRAAADISDDKDIVVIGSRAILGQFPNAPESMRVSMKADLYPLHHRERSDLIDGSIGEVSPFHKTDRSSHRKSHNHRKKSTNFRDKAISERVSNLGTTSLAKQMRFGKPCANAAPGST